MPYEQVENILERARQFHLKLSKFYQGLDDLTGDEDEALKMILAYLQEHEEKLEKQLEEFDKSALRNVMDTWVQFPPAEPINHILDKLDLNAKMSVNDLIVLALRFDSALLNFYSEASEKAPTGKAKEIFETLYEEGKSERRTLVGSVFEY